MTRILSESIYLNRVFVIATFYAAAQTCESLQRLLKHRDMSPPGQSVTTNSTTYSMVMPPLGAIPASLPQTTLNSPTTQFTEPEERTQL